jgi:hypothetical protein
VMFGDCGTAPLEMLGAVSRDVMLPMLSKAADDGRWPELLSRQITDSLYKFVADGTSRNSPLSDFPPLSGFPPSKLLGSDSAHTSHF